MASFQVPFPENAAPNVQQLLSPEDSLARVLPSQPQGPRGSRRKSQKPIDYLPGFPNIPLNRTKISEFIQKELGTPILDELYPRLWFVARKSSSNIDPLHRQATKGRKIFITEDSQLHLTWQDDRIYIKPVPLWLLNYQVWLRYLSPIAPEQTCVDPNEKDQVSFLTIWEPHERATALGFLRSHAHLIEHYSDFVIAHQHRLLPPGVDWITWSRFIAHFRDAGDDDVSHRYHYGQLRLSRLHWAVRLFRPRAAHTWWFYHLPYWSTTPYLQSILAPLLVAFATFSLVLSAMQVAVGIPADGLKFSRLTEIGLENMRRAFWVFSIMVLIILGVVWILLGAIPLTVLMWQLLWGFNHRHKAINQTRA